MDTVTQTPTRKTSFQRVPSAEGAVIDVPGKVENQSPAPERPANPAAIAVAPANRGAFSDDDEGISFGEVLLPRLNIVQKVGELSNIFSPGAIVLNSQLVMLDAPAQAKPNEAPRTQPNPLRIVFLGFKGTQYVEKVPGGGMGSLVDTVEEVIALGGTIDYNEARRTNKPEFQTMKTAMVVIEQPEIAKDDSTSFVYEVAGKHYAVGLWSMKGTAYTRGAKVVMTARKIGHLKDGLLATRSIEPERGGYVTGVWNLSTLLTQFGQNFAYVPILRPSIIEGKSEETSLAFREFAKSLTS